MGVGLGVWVVWVVWVVVYNGGEEGESEVLRGDVEEGEYEVG